MMDKEQVAKAITNIDNILGRAKFIEPVLSRDEHRILAQNLNLLQDCCKQYFDKEEPKDGGTNIVPIRSEPGDENSEGSGDSV